jgi:hypothetical protein
MAILVRSGYIPFPLDHIVFVESVPSSLAYFQWYLALGGVDDSSPTLLGTGCEHSLWSSPNVRIISNLAD